MWFASIHSSIILLPYSGSLLGDVLLIEKIAIIVEAKLETMPLRTPMVRMMGTCLSLDMADYRAGSSNWRALATNAELLEHLCAHEDIHSKDDADDGRNGHAQRDDNAAPVRPRPPSTFSRALRGDAEVADVAGDEDHVCLDHADDRKIGNGLHGPERS